MSEEAFFTAIDYLRSEDPKDHEAAFNIFNQLANGRPRNNDAVYMVGDMLIRGDGTPKNTESGLAMLSSLIDVDHVDAMKTFGNYFYAGLWGIGRDVETAFNVMSLAHGKGDHNISYQLAVMSELGQGTERDMNAAINMYKEVPRNNQSAYFYLAKLLMDNNISEGQQIMLDLANKGFAPACLEIGKMYYEVQRDYNTAKQYFSVAAKKGIIIAHFYMGVIYEYGLSVDRDIDRAIKFYYSPASLGNPDTIERLKNLLLQKGGQNNDNGNDENKTNDILLENIVKSIPVPVSSCTFNFTKLKPSLQHMFECRTCGLYDGRGVCVICARMCHMGHALLDRGITNDLYCGCCNEREGCCLMPSKSEGRPIVI